MKVRSWISLVLVFEVSMIAISLGVQANPPSISPAPGIYPVPIDVELSSPLRNSSFKYRTDGVTPGISFPGADYSGPIGLGPGDYEIAAVTNAPFYDTSEVAEAAYIIGNPSLPSMVLVIEEISFEEHNIYFRNQPDGAQIFYSFGNEELSSNSLNFDEPIPLPGGEYTIRAFSYHQGEVSEVQTWNFMVQDQQLRPPVISPAGASSTGPITVSITSPDEGAVIRYTTNGFSPNASSPIYEGPFVISNEGAPRLVRVQAIALKEGYRASPRVAEDFTIEELPQSPVPVIFPDEGAYQLPLTVFLSHSQGDEAIRYTTDGSTPTVSSPSYPAEGIIISDPGAGPVVTIKAAAIQEGHRLSEIVESSFVVGAATFASYLDLYLPDDRFPASVRNWTSDPDGDGFETGMEYASGTDPLDRNGFPVFRARNEGDHLIVEYRNAQQATDIEWSFEWSKDGELWNPLGSDADIAMTDSVASTEESGTIENRDLRLIPVSEQPKILVRLKVLQLP